MLIIMKLLKKNGLVLKFGPHMLYEKKKVKRTTRFKRTKHSSIEGTINRSTISSKISINKTFG